MKQLYLLTFSLLSCFNLVLAQGGWQTIYPIQSSSQYGDGIDAVRQTPDGGYILAGVSEVNSSASQNRVAKVNDQGIIQWSNSYAAVGSYSWATNVELSPNGGYFIEGYRTNPVTFAREVYLQRLDANGNQVWLNFYPQAQNSSNGSVTSDGGFVQVGYYDNNGIQDTISVIKTDASGNLEWLNKYPNTGTGIERIPTSIIQTSNNEFVVAGYKDQGFGGLNFLWRLSTTGDSLWQNTYGALMNHPEYIGQVLELQDGSLVALANDAVTFGANDFYLYKTDASGNLLWDKHYQQANSFGTHLDATSDGGFILTGYQLLASVYRVVLIKTDQNGDQQWLKTFNGNGTGSFKSYCVQQTSDGGYIIGAAKIQSAYTSLNMYLIKTDELGEIYGNTLQGYVYADANADCMVSDGEYSFGNWLVKAEGLQTFYTSTDANGFYWVRVDTGSYELTLTPAATNVYWETASCANDTIQINIPQNLTTIETSFPQSANAYCPLLTVDMGTPFLRRCFNNTYVIHYCNNGTAAAENAYVDVTFDEYLEVDNASISGPFVQLDSTTYRFTLGNLEIGECGNIPVSVYVSCDSYLGQTHCNSAEIFPNESCLEPVWEGPFITLDAECRTDSAVFIITNSGGLMSLPQAYFIYENGTIIDQGTVELVAGQEIELVYEVNPVSSYRININQAAGLPSILGDPIASIAVFGCDIPYDQDWVTQFSNYDGSPFVDVDCRQNIGAYDPNDKQASPVGYGSEHFIEENTDLEYLIRFQNTGTDTAFTIVIRDTISSALDLSSLQAGAASHAYTWRFYGEGVQAVEFTFNNIMLPDSFVNEPASNGFIKYRIKQLRDNVIGTVINNTAAIYFDFNEPIFTNTTFHEIGEDYIPEVLVTTVNNAGASELDAIKIYPNPFTTQTTFELPEAANATLTLIDTQGRLVRSVHSMDKFFQLSSDGLAKGVYFYSILSEETTLYSGKVIVY
jgi:hypothetical protein